MNATWGFDATAMFTPFRTLCSCPGKDSEYVLFTRIGRGIKRFSVSNVYWGIMRAKSNFVIGDIVYDPDMQPYFLVAKVDSYRADKAEFYKPNCKVKLTRLQDKYEGYDKVGNEEVVISDNVDGVYEDVSARMKMYDLGLYQSTVKTLLVPKSTDVKLLDRIYMDGYSNECFKVDNVSLSSFPEFLFLQVSLDDRG